MSDMLVRLYDLEDYSDLYGGLAKQGIRIQRPMTPNKQQIHAFVAANFSERWADEISTAFTRFPVSCFIAYDENTRQILGFAGYDCTCKGFFGPTGVHESHRGKGIGTALLTRCLEAMREEGYAYAIIGSVGPVKFYEKTVGAIEIEGSTPGIYAQLLK